MGVAIGCDFKSRHKSTIGVGIQLGVVQRKGSGLAPKISEIQKWLRLRGGNGDIGKKEIWQQRRGPMADNLRPFTPGLSL